MYFFKWELQQKKRTQKLDEITADISAAKSLNKTNPSPSFQAKIFQLRYDLRAILLKSRVKNYKKLKAFTYTTGNKAGKAMSLRVQGHREN